MQGCKAASWNPTWTRDTSHTTHRRDMTVKEVMCQLAGITCLVPLDWEGSYNGFRVADLSAVEATTKLERGLDARPAPKSRHTEPHTYSSIFPMPKDPRPDIPVSEDRQLRGMCLALTYLYSVAKLRRGETTLNRGSGFRIGMRGTP